MTDDFIPDDIKQFFQQNVVSVAQWEGLLLMRSNPESEWTSESLARELYIPEASAVEILGQLTSLGYVGIFGTGVGNVYHYHSISPEHEALLERASQTYRKYLVPITNLIHAKPANSIQKFADAFKLGKD